MNISNAKKLAAVTAAFFYHGHGFFRLFRECKFFTDHKQCFSGGKV